MFLAAYRPNFHGKPEKGTFPDMYTYALSLNVPDLDPVQYGWTKDKAAKSLAAVHVPRNTDLALSYIQDLIKCFCSSDPPYVAKCKLWLHESRDAVFCILCM